MFSDQNVVIVLFLLLGMTLICARVAEYKAGNWGWGGYGCVALSFLIVVLKVFGRA